MRALQRSAGNRAVARLIEGESSDASSAEASRKALVKGKLNVAGEAHPESSPRRDEEKAYGTEQAAGGYWTEGQFSAASSVFTTARLGDPFMLRAEMLLAVLKEKSIPLFLAPLGRGELPAALNAAGDTATAWGIYKGRLKDDILEIAVAIAKASKDAAETDEAQKAGATHGALMRLAGQIDGTAVDKVADIDAAAKSVITQFAGDVLGAGDIRAEAVVSDLRSKAMNAAATDNAGRWVGGQTGLWKVGNTHIPEMKAVKGAADYEILTKDEFNADFDPWAAKRRRGGP